MDIEIPGQPSETVPDTLKPRGDSTSSTILESDGPELDRPADRVRVRPMDGQAGMSARPRTGGPIPFTPAGDSRHVAAIVIDRMLTGGINAGGRAGDGGLLVVVEPRDRAGRAIDAPADMSVVVLDPAILDNRGKAARVGRWDFTTAETAALFRRTDSSRAVHLAMAWPADPPRHGKLHLFVRYATADGRRLEADSPIEVALAGQRQAGWQPAPPSARGADGREFNDGRNGGAESSSSSASWRPNETPTSRADGAPPEMATRTDPLRPERPAWSPDRQ